MHAKFYGAVTATYHAPGYVLSVPKELKMASFPRYRSEDHIKINRLHVDLRMNWNPMGTC
jgi:hypothetical protein